MRSYVLIKISNQPLWLDKELARLKNVKSRLYKKFRASGPQAAFSRYLGARSDFTVLNAQCYKNYLTRCKTQFTLDPKQFYSFANTKCKSSSYPSSIKFENSAANSDQAIADLFARLFQTTYSTSSPPDQSYPYDIPKLNFILCPVISESSLLLDLKGSNQSTLRVLTESLDVGLGIALRLCVDHCTICYPAS